MPITQQQAYGFWDYLLGTEQGGGADVGQIGGSCTDHQGLLGAKGAKVSCADLRAAQEGKEAGSYTAYTGSAMDKPKKASSSSKSSSSATAKSGKYRDNEYIYDYDAKTGAITIVVSPMGSGNTVVEKGSSAYDAILKMITSGGAKLISEQEASAAKKSVAPIPPSVSPQDIKKGAEKAAKVPFYQETWFLVGAPLTLAVIIGAAIIFWPKGEDEE